MSEDFSSTLAGGTAEDDDEFVGDTLPPFATDEIKEKFRLLQAKDRKCDELEMAAVEERERIDNMTQHLKNVQKEIKNSEALLDFKRKEMESKEHLMALDQRQIGRLESEILKNRKISQDRKRMVNDARNAIEKWTSSALSSEWGQEELEQWVIAARQKEEDEMQLEEYRRADDVKVKNLRKELEEVLKRIHDTKQELSDRATETEAMQIEMNKISQQLEQATEARAADLAAWEAGVDANKRKDQELIALGEQHAQESKRHKEKELKISDLRKIDDNYEKSIKEKESLVSLTDRELGMLRLENLKVEVVRAELNAAKAEENQKRVEIEQWEQRVEEQKKKVANLRKRLAVEEKKKSEVEQSKMNKEEVAREAEEMMGKAVERAGELEQQLKLAKEDLFKTQQELYKERENETTKLGEISGLQSAIKNVKSRISKVDAERQRQQSNPHPPTQPGVVVGEPVEACLGKLQSSIWQEVSSLFSELLYNVDFECQLMQRKVARISGERSVEEKEELNRKITNYEGQLQEQQGEGRFSSVAVNAGYSFETSEDDLFLIVCDLIVTGFPIAVFMIYCTTGCGWGPELLKRWKGEVREAKKRLANARAVEKENEERVKDLEREIEMTAREDTQKKNERDEAAAQRESLKLEVQRLKAPLLELVENVVAAENRKMQMQLEFQEKEQELHIICEELRTELRLVNEQKQALQMQLAERKQKIYNIKAKFDGMVQRRKAMMADGDGGEEKSQAYFVLKAAQMKDSLQREGDEIDRKIRIAEQELHGLENSLGYLINSNQKYKAGLKSTGERERRKDEKVLGEGDALERQLRHASEVLHKKKKRMADLTAIADADEARKLQMIEDSRHLRAKIARLVDAKNRLSRDLTEGSAKIGRASRSLEAMQERVASAIQSGNLKQESEVAATAARLSGVEEQQQHLIATLKSLCRTIVDHQPANDSVAEFLADRLESVGITFAQS
ncbi:hypothetical protein FOZ60_013534 [Perkinsus olseni]|uniref:Coiled-coil domain containing n=3 Tax=Perkinsus olseni TaxID=32597 RepID=A0A7J6PAN5_PEROL|nr:hypothetical protein FOZ60_013534 [Perkinsus olseni]